MSLDTAEKQKLIENHQVHPTDTGSVEIQVAMLSKRISKLSDHLQGNIHDFASRQGLLKMIGKRKRLLSYFCLLYTSPSPRDPKTSRMPSSA